MPMIDGRTLEPDLSQSVGLALGLGKQLRQNRAQAQTGQLIDQAMNAPDEEVMGLLGKIAQVGGPQMAQGVMQLIQAGDQRELVQAQQEASDMQVFAAKLRNIEDPRDRMTFIRKEIDRRAGEGRPYNRLLEPANMDFEQQNFWSTQNMINADNVGKVVERFLPQDPLELAEQDLKRDRLGLDREKLGLEKGKLQLERDKLSSEPKVNPKLFEQEQKLRKEVNDVTKDFRKINDSYATLVASSTNPTPAGDIAMIFNYMKMLDPGSVVRESEFKVAESAAPLFQRFGLSWDKHKSLWEGKRLTPSQRADFVDRAFRIYKEKAKNYNKRVDQYTGVATRAGIDPQNVILDQELYKDQGSGLTPEDQAELEALRKEQGK